MSTGRGEGDKAKVKVEVEDKTEDGGWKMEERRLSTDFTDSADGSDDEPRTKNEERRSSTDFTD
jgi:hypothetical protein